MIKEHSLFPVGHYDVNFTRLQCDGKQQDGEFWCVVFCTR